MSRRPELEVPASIYYGDENAHKYHVSTRVQQIQRLMTARAIELLALPQGEPCLILDLGAGTGLAGEVLHAAGHTFVGTDIARPMLNIAKRREFEAAEARANESEEEDEEEDDEEDEEEDEEDGENNQWAGGDVPPQEPTTIQQLAQRSEEIEGAQAVEVLQHDMGTTLPFRPGSFDGCISISALQWLCNIDRKGQVPQRRLKALFQSLFNSLRSGARAVLQFYPANKEQTAMISTIATSCGFGGGVLIDYPHSARARKFYLVLYAGLAPKGYRPPPGLSIDGGFSVGDDDDDFGGVRPEEEEAEGARQPRRERVQKAGRARQQKTYGNKRLRREGGASDRAPTGSKAWVMYKKEQRRKFGEETRPDSRYTARKRPSKW